MPIHTYIKFHGKKIELVGFPDEFLERVKGRSLDEIIKEWEKYNHG